MKNKKKIWMAFAAMFAMVLPMVVFASDGAENVPAVYQTFWALLPPIIAIGLALITKEVYSSLFVGIFVGGLLYSNFNIVDAVNHVFFGVKEVPLLDDNGVAVVIEGEAVTQVDSIYGMIPQLSDAWNVGILVFLVFLGAIVALMNKAGGSAAFGEWASKNIKSKVGAQLATIALGCLIFIDDYFNCLTVGSVMKPVTDKHKISREKLSYLIDATAAPVCIIAPISSWAAAVTGFVPGEENGLSIFVQAIPYNFYALLTIVFMLAVVLMKVDFGTMKKAEVDVQAKLEEKIAEVQKNTKARIIDLILPIIVLIAACVVGMIYTGGFFEGATFVEAFAGSDASVGLVYGSFIGIVFTVIYYLCRRLINFKESMECIPEGFKAMVPAILILTFAWTLKAMTDSLGAADYVAALVEGSAAGFQMFLPAIIFVIACFLAFATGTSWGTFGILIPIVVAVFQNTDYTMMIISISACMAGAVCGDHCSPISDTTIMASAGAECEHINHVRTQLPYALTVAAISFVTYIVAGLTKSAWISLPVGIVLTIGTLFVIKAMQKNK